MTSKRWLGTTLSVTMLTAVALTGCSSSQETSGPAPAAKADDQVLNMEMASEIPTMDTSKMSDLNGVRLAAHVGEGLVRVDSTGKASPGVATTWEVSPDGLTYTFHLRDNSKWSDGSTVTAHDFVYAWKRTLNPETKAGYAFILYWIKGGEAYNQGKGTAEQVGVKATDDRTLQVTLEYPIPFFVEQMNFPIFYPQKQAAVEKHGDNYAADADKLLFNGPFQMTEWIHEQSLTLAKNDLYWNKDAVKLDKVYYQVVKDRNAAENLYQTGQIDRIELIGEQVDRYKGTPEHMVIPELVSGYLQFNMTQIPYLQNVNIRKALTYAIDTQKYVDIVHHNGSKPATGLVPAGTSNGQGGDFRKDQGDLLNRAENDAKAKEYLTKGLQELGLPQLPPVRLMTDDEDQGRKASQFILEQWRQKLGIEAVIENVPLKLKQTKLKNKDYDVTVALWGADYNDPMTFLDRWATPASSYQSPTYNALIQTAMKEPDKKKRIQALGEAERVMMNDMAVGPIFFRATDVAMKTHVKGWTVLPGAVDYDLTNVYIEGKK